MLLRAAVLGSVCGLAILQASCASSGPHPQTVEGRWELVRLRGKAVIERPLPVEFKPDGSVAWHGGINHYGGRYRVSGNSICIDHLLHTLIGSSKELEEQEDAFEKAMEGAKTFFVDDDGRLILNDSHGHASMVFRRLLP